MRKCRKHLAVFLSAVMTVCMMCGCADSKNGEKDNATDSEVTIDVYSQLADCQRPQEGWFAQIIQDKLNIHINVLTGVDYTEEQMKEKLPGDINIFALDIGSMGYLEAIENGKLMNLSQTNVLKQYGEGILKQQDILLRDENGDIFGIYLKNAKFYEYDEPIMTFDIRYDYYSEMEYPEINTLDDLYNVLYDMYGRYSGDGNNVYAAAITDEYDNSEDAGLPWMPSAMVSAYYGYDSMGLGFYNDGEYVDAFAVDSDGSYGPYFQILEFYNRLYRNGMLLYGSNRDIVNQVEKGNILWSYADYYGSRIFNTDSNLSKGKAMLSVVPKEAKPAVYGLSMSFNRCVGISSDTEYPEECVKLLNYIFSPEGMLEMEYGPKGLCWDYDDDGKAYMTELGKACMKDLSTVLTSDEERFARYNGMKFCDGVPLFNSLQYSRYSVNPDSGERYSNKYWANENMAEEGTVMADWQDRNDAINIYEYVDNNVDYTLVIDDSFSGYNGYTIYREAGKAWTDISDIIITGSHSAIKAATEEEFKAAVEDMIAKAKAAGYDECVSWGIKQSKIRKAYEDRLLKQ